MSTQVRPFDVTDDVHHLRLVRPRPAFVDDGQVRVVEALRQRPRTHHATDVRRHHDDVLVALPVRIAQQHRRGVHVVHRDVEESLDLLGVQIDGQQPVHARALQHVRHELRRDRGARRARPPILARVAEVRHHRGDARRRGAPRRVDHHEQLDQVLVHRRTRGLHDEHIAPAHVLHQLDVHFAVGKPSDVGAAQRRGQVTRDVMGQCLVGIAREQRQRF